MRRFIFLLACSLASGYSAERIFSLGIKGGVPLTDAFSDHTSSGVDTVTRTFSDSKNYVIGPSIELNLPFGFSAEADALYRPLNLGIDLTVVPQPLRRSVTDINAWEFPILGKYHFLHTPILKPYVEAGPIFRHVGSRGSQLSNSGFALGGGIDLKLLLVRITPELRFSRWGGDSDIPNLIAAPSQLNQAEFLIGISF